MTPVVGNPAFGPGLTDDCFLRLDSTEGARLGFYRAEDKKYTVSELQNLVNPPLSKWSALQLDHFIQKINPNGESLQLNTKFEELCCSDEPIRHGLALMYKWLTHRLEDNKEDYTLVYIKQWERDLQRTFSARQKRCIYYMTHKASIANKIQENGFKILTRWYWTPQRLSKVFPGTTDICWRCNHQLGTFFHIFWMCPKIVPFWKEVKRVCRMITGLELGDDPAVYLLHLTPMSISKYRGSLLQHLLNGAKLCIPLCWKRIDPPTIGLWFSKIREIYEMEDFVSRVHKKEVQFGEIWSQWKQFMSSDEYCIQISKLIP